MVRVGGDCAQSAAHLAQDQALRRDRGLGLARRAHPLEHVVQHHDAERGIGEWQQPIAATAYPATTSDP